MSIFKQDVINKFFVRFRKYEKRQVGENWVTNWGLGNIPYFITQFSRLDIVSIACVHDLRVTPETEKRKMED